MTFARSVPARRVASSASFQSASSMRTERCFVFGLLGTRSSVPGVRTVFNATPLRCTYTQDTLVYVHRNPSEG